MDRLVALKSGLSRPAFAPIFPAMASSQAKRIVALLLAILVTAGMGLSAVGTGGMQATMAMGADMDPAGTTDCGPCGGSDAEAMACPVSTCPPPVLAEASPAMSAMVAQSSRLTPAGSTRPLGRTSLPDPYPPRSSDPV